MSDEKDEGCLVSGAALLLMACSIPYLLVYGFAISRLAFWAGWSITVLQGALLDVIVGLVAPGGHVRLLTGEIHKALHKDGKTDHGPIAASLVSTAGWFLMPWVGLGCGWVVRWTWLHWFAA